MAQGCFAYFGFRVLGFRGFRVEGLEGSGWRVLSWPFLRLKSGNRDIGWLKLPFPVLRVEVGGCRCFNLLGSTQRWSFLNKWILLWVSQCCEPFRGGGYLLRIPCFENNTCSCYFEICFGVSDGSLKML